MAVWQTRIRILPLRLNIQLGRLDILGDNRAVFNLPIWASLMDLINGSQHLLFPLPFCLAIYI